MIVDKSFIIVTVALLFVKTSFGDVVRRRPFECEHGTLIRPEVCECEAGYEGERCNHLICYNGGTYDHHHHRCNCVAEYAGLHCENSVSHPICMPNPCRNGGHCYHDNTQFICNCQPQFTGLKCEQKVIPTTAKPTDAPTHAHTHAPVTEVTTTAIPTTTTAKVDMCQFSPCVRGMCLSTITGYYCYCPQDFAGQRCEQTCHNNPCQNGGHCYDDGPTSYVCLCLAGFTGNNCEKSRLLGEYAQNILQRGITKDTITTQASVLVNGTGGGLPTRAPQYNTCNEIDLILALSNGGRIDEPSARTCQNETTKYQPEAIILKHCSSTAVKTWRQGVQVTKNCSDIPHYVAVAQFHRGVPTLMAGVFVKCEPDDMFQMLTQSCEDDFKLQKVGWPESDSYFVVEWQ